MFAKSLVLDLHTVLTQSVRTSKTSLGALRQAQSLDTSSQPDGSANPIGIRQLYTQDGCDMTAGSAVMLYAGEEEVTAALMAMLVDAAGIGRLFGTAVEDDCARERPSRRKRYSDFMVMCDMICRLLTWEWLQNISRYPQRCGKEEIKKKEQKNLRGPLSTANRFSCRVCNSKVGRLN